MCNSVAITHPPRPPNLTGDLRPPQQTQTSDAVLPALSAVSSRLPLVTMTFGDADERSLDFSTIRSGSKSKNQKEVVLHPLGLVSQVQVEEYNVTTE